MPVRIVFCEATVLVAFPLHGFVIFLKGPCPWFRKYPTAVIHCHPLASLPCAIVRNNPEGSLLGQFSVFKNKKLKQERGMTGRNK